jgi:tryptophan-rich sensory protein
MVTASKTLSGKTLSIKTQGVEQRWRWYHGLLFYLFAQIAAFGLALVTNVATGQKVKNLRDAFGDVSYFRALRQSIITPPSWVFGPAWTINNISVIWGTLRVLNKPRDTPGKSSYLALQAASWLNFVVFNAAYFSLRSPINAFALTLTMFILTILSGLVALFQLKDTKVALSLATLSIWLVIALTAATFQVAWNKDDLYQVGPFSEPAPALEKKSA